MWYVFIFLWSSVAVLWATLSSVPSASLLPTHPTPPSGLTLTILTSPKPQQWSTTVPCVLPGNPHIWSTHLARPRLKPSGVHHVVQKRRISFFRRPAPPNPPCWQLDWLEEQCLWGCLSEGSAQRKDKDGLPGMRSRHPILPGGNIWPLQGEPECFCLHVSQKLREYVCLHVFFSFFSTFYVKCTYLTEGFTLLWDSIRMRSWSYGALGPVVDGILVTIPWVPDRPSFSGTQKNWEGHFIHWDSHLDMFVRLSSFPQIWTSSYFCVVVVSQ